MLYLKYMRDLRTNPGGDHHIRLKRPIFYLTCTKDPRSSCSRAYSEMDSHDTRLCRYGTLSTALLTDYHHTSIIVLSAHHVWKVDAGFLDWVWPKTLKWVVVFSVWRSTSMDSTMAGRPCIRILWQGGASCPVSAAWHSCQCVAAHRLVGWLCLTSHRQWSHLETAPPFTVLCEGREAR